MKFIQSPLNYTGSKYKLLPQIYPYFPKHCDVFVDLFCGGAAVGINALSNKTILNDKQYELIRLFQYFKNNEINQILDSINKIITEFNLSQSSIFGYDFYDCNSSNGLSKFNKNSFLKLRNQYNKSKNEIELFVLIIFAFNNQIRFNSSGLFNLPCGKRDFNNKIKEKLEDFVNAIKSDKFILSNYDFRNFLTHFEYQLTNKKVFFYIDPPYFLANATYNENNSWKMKDELDLLEFCENLNNKNYHFAFSNVILHKGKVHNILKEWSSKNNFKIYNLQKHYTNSNYQVKFKDKNQTQEILICNF